MKDFLKEKKNLWLLTWPVGIIMYLVASNNSEAAENVFANGIYKGYGWVISHLTGGADFSIAEMLVVAVPLLTISIIAVGIKNIVAAARRKKDTSVPVAVLRLVRNLLILTGVIYAWYMIGCGTNYYRYEFSRYSGLKIEKSTTDELYDLYSELVDNVNSSYEAAVKTETERGMKMTSRERINAAREAMNNLGAEYEVLDGFYPKPKEVFFSRTMSRFGITGVYFPWTVEANVNVDVPAYSIPSTMCHELSHLRGFMREDEANFIGYLACVRSDEPEFVYSGYMEALIHTGNRLYGDSPELYYKAAAGLCDGVRADLIENNEYWEQFEDTVTNEVGEKVNDTYLKANKQTDGTKSYGRMVDLLLAEWKMRKNQ